MCAQFSLAHTLPRPGRTPTHAGRNTRCLRRHPRTFVAVIYSHAARHADVLCTFHSSHCRYMKRGSRRSRPARADETSPDGEAQSHPSGSTSSFSVRATRFFFTRTRRESAPGKNATSLATTETTTTNQHAVRAATAPAAATQSSKSTMPKYEKALTTQNRKKMLIVMLYLLSGQGAG